MGRVLVLFALLVAMNVLAARLGAGDDESAVVSMLIIQALDTVLILVWYVAWYREAVGHLFATAGPAGPYLVVLAACYPLGLVFHLFVRALSEAFGLPELSYSEEFLGAGYGVPVLILSLSVQPAIFEELAFRGIIQTTLKRFTGPKEALFIASVGFAILHFSLVTFPALFLMGLLLGWLRDRSGSLYPSMLLHFIHNTLVVVDERVGIFPG